MSSLVVSSPTAQSGRHISIRHPSTSILFCMLDVGGCVLLFIQSACDRGMFSLFFVLRKQHEMQGKKRKKASFHDRNRHTQTAGTQRRESGKRKMSAIQINGKADTLKTQTDRYNFKAVSGLWIWTGNIITNTRTDATIMSWKKKGSNPPRNCTASLNSGARKILLSCAVQRAGKPNKYVCVF